MPRKVRDYKAEYTQYHSQPEQIKKRDERNKARAEYEKVHGNLSSNTDVDHKRPISKGGTSSMSNLRAVSQNENTSFARTKKGALKSQTSRRERSK